MSFIIGGLILIAVGFYLNTQLMNVSTQIDKRTTNIPVYLILVVVAIVGILFGIGLTVYCLSLALI